MAEVEVVPGDQLLQIQAADLLKQPAVGQQILLRAAVDQKDTGGPAVEGNRQTADENAVDILLSKCKEKNIPLYLQGLNKESALYDSSNNLQDKGVNLVYNSTPEYAYATLMIKVNS